MKVRKMKRLRILIVALCVCLIAGVAETLNMVDAYGVEHSNHCICGDTTCDGTATRHSKPTAWQKWEEVWDSTSGNINYGESSTLYVYLTSDVTLTKKLDLNNGNTLYLCLNGHSIVMNDDTCSQYWSDGVINISKNTTLVLCDCNGSREGKGIITHGKDTDNKPFQGIGVKVGEETVSAGTFIMYGGAISDNTASGGVILGGGVYLNGGIFEMRGGTISNNTVTGGEGGGVCIRKPQYNISSTFNMYGGTICNNKLIDASNYGGGGVCVYNSGEFNMYNGIISDNNVINNDGGGVSVAAASFNMYGGTISGNTASKNGGGIAAYNDNFTLTGGEIKNNSANKGGGVYMYEGNSDYTITLSGNTSITGNTAAEQGGGVYYSEEPFDFSLSGNVNIKDNVKGGTISNGTLTGGTPNNVYLSSGKTIRIAGALTGSPIGVTTADAPDENAFVRIAQADNAAWAVPGKFTYENDSTRIFTKTGYTTYLVACKHNYNTSWLSDDSDHWHKCRNCDEIETKTAHDYTQQITNENYLKTAATCTDKAVYYKSCICGKAGTETFEDGEINANNHTGTLGDWQSDDNNHWKEYSCCSKEEEKAGHTWVAGEVTKDASCAEKGSQKYACSVCGKEKIEELSATGHIYTAEIKSDDTLKTRGTCVAEAVYYYSCTNCGEVEKDDSHTFTGEKDADNHTGTLGDWQIDDNNHWRVYSCCSARANEAAHTWDGGTITKEASCTGAGSKVFTCGICKKEKTEVLDAKGHDYTAETKSDDTLKTPGTCVAEAVYYYSCIRCGTIENSDNHIFKGEKDATNHTGTLGDWQSDNDNHWKIYSCCKAEAEKAKHTWDDGRITKDASCIEAGVKTFTCATCNKEKTESIATLGHDLVHHNAQAATCTEIGWEAYDTCSRCDYTTYNEIPAVGHKYKAEWYSDSEKHWHECDVCKDKKDEADHTWDNGAVTTEPTTTAEGVKTYTCTGCGATKTESVAKIPTGGGVITPPKTDTITADVTGDKTSVKITAEISGDTASIAEIGKNDIDKAGAGVDITIDLTVIPKEVVSVTVTKKSLDNIYESKSDNVSIKLTESTVNMDRDTLKNIIDQMKGSDLKLVVDKHQEALESMNKVQQDAVKDMREPKIMDAYFISGDIRITDFKGGSVDIAVPYPDKKGVKAWYIDDNGIKEPVPVSYDGKTAVITVNHFSHYVLEEDDSDNVEPVPVKKTVDKVLYVKSAKYSKKTGTKITFNKVSGADGYYVYGNRCNTDKVYTFKKLATLKGNDNTVFVHKKTAKNTFYKYYIKAYKVVDGKRVTVSRSEEIHFVTDVKGYKYGNPTKVTLSVKKYTLSKGKTFNLKNRVKVYSSKKVLLHTDKIRYVSSDSSIAKVNSKGKITAKKAGSCNIYAIAQNGKAAKIAVTVK